MVRKRPGMYIGSTGKTGLIILFLRWLIIVDEAMAGHCTDIHVTIEEGMLFGCVIMVGYSIDTHKDKNLPAVEY